MYPEQELNVDLAVRQGMALAVAPRHADGEKMTAAIRRVASEPGFRHEAMRVKTLYAGTDGAASAAAAITRFLAGDEVSTVRGARRLAPALGDRRTHTA